MSGEPPVVPYGFQRWGAGALPLAIFKKHNMPLETLLFRRSCSFINHTPQRRTEWGQFRQYGARETPCSRPKNEVLIKLHTMTSQHIAPSTQLDYRSRLITGSYYLPKVCMNMYEGGSLCEGIK